MRTAAKRLSNRWRLSGILGLWLAILGSFTGLRPCPVELKLIFCSSDLMMIFDVLPQVVLPIIRTTADPTWISFIPGLFSRPSSVFVRPQVVSHLPALAFLARKEHAGLAAVGVGCGFFSLTADAFLTSARCWLGGSPKTRGFAWLLAGSGAPSAQSPFGVAGSTKSQSPPKTW